MPDWAITGDGQYKVTYGNVASTDGVQALAGANGSYGAWVQIIPANSSTSITASGFIYTACQTFTDKEYAVDIGVGTAGSEKTIVQRLYIPGGGAIGWGGFSYYIPIEIPQNARVAVRCCTNDTVAGGPVTNIITLCGQGFRPGAGLNKCTTYNMKGTALDAEIAQANLITPGAALLCNINLVTAGSPGTWVDITTTSAGLTLRYPISSVMFVLTPETADAAFVAGKYFLDIGNAASSVIYIENIPIQLNAIADVIVKPILGPWPLSLPAGATVQARLTNYSTTDPAAGHRKIGVIMYGLS